LFSFLPLSPSESSLSSYPYDSTLNSLSFSLIRSSSFFSFCLLPTLLSTFYRLLITDRKSLSTASPSLICSLLVPSPSNIVWFTYFSRYSINLLILFFFSRADTGFDNLALPLPGLPTYLPKCVLADFLSPRGSDLSSFKLSFYFFTSLLSCTSLWVYRLGAGKSSFLEACDLPVCFAYLCVYLGSYFVIYL
jgi:hypothetical protein